MIRILGRMECNKGLQYSLISCVVINLSVRRALLVPSVSVHVSVPSFHQKGGGLVHVFLILTNPHFPFFLSRFLLSLFPILNLNSIVFFECSIVPYLL